MNPDIRELREFASSVVVKTINPRTTELVSTFDVFDTLVPFTLPVTVVADVRQSTTIEYSVLTATATPVSEQL